MLVAPISKCAPKLYERTTRFRASGPGQSPILYWYRKAIFSALYGLTEATARVSLTICLGRGARVRCIRMGQLPGYGASPGLLS